MSIQNPIVNASVATNSFRGARSRLWARGLFRLAVGAPVMFFPEPARGQVAATPEPAPTVVQTDVKLVIGGETVRNNSEGTLSIVGSSLQFATGKAKVEVKASSILDISTNEDSRQDITGAAHFATIAIPYGGGRLLSLFSHKVDVLTLEFKDANGGYHGTVFVLPQGQAAPIKKQLVAMGAKASVPLAEPAPTNNRRTTVEASQSNGSLSHFAYRPRLRPPSHCRLSMGAEGLGRFQECAEILRLFHSNRARGSRRLAYTAGIPYGHLRKPDRAD